MGKLNQFIEGYIKKNISRFHVPGHQGRCRFLNDKLGAKFDITEVEGADWLFNNQGVLQQLEQKLASLFNNDLAISTSGSTLCIQTMVALCKNKIFIVHRDSAHVAFFNSCILFNIDVYWFGKFANGEAVTNYEINEIKNILKMFPKGSCAVYLTSPDYYGNLTPIEDVVRVCREFNALLLVDCAHGAHLNFVKTGLHPINLGADLCCSSWHKTLPTLTGAAVLHFNSNIFSKLDVKNKMSLLASTSPSYLIMSSIDFCADWLLKKGEDSFYKLKLRKQKLINNINLPFIHTDITKLTIDCRNINLNGFDIAKILRRRKVEPEFVGENFIILVLSPFLSFIDWHRLQLALKEVEKQTVFRKLEAESKDQYNHNNHSLSYRYKFDVDFCMTKMVELNVSIGKICAETKFKSPPGTVLISVGECLNLDIIRKLEAIGCKQIKIFTEK